MKTHIFSFQPGRVFEAVHSHGCCMALRIQHTQSPNHHTSYRDCWPVVNKQNSLDSDHPLGTRTLDPINQPFLFPTVLQYNQPTHSTPNTHTVLSHPLIQLHQSIIFCSKTIADILSPSAPPSTTSPRPAVVVHEKLASLRYFGRVLDLSNKAKAHIDTRCSCVRYCVSATVLLCRDAAMSFPR